jgi:hypothetical protein
MRRLVFSILVAASCAFAQDAAPDATPAASPSPTGQPSGEETPAEQPAPSDAPGTTSEDSADDTPATDDLPASPEDAAPLSAEDIIPMAPMPNLALPDEALVDPEAIFADELPPLPPPAIAIESAAEKQRDALIRYREVRLEADKDPQVAAMRERAATERTLEGKRAALREYYRLLFAKVAKIDSSLKARAEMMETAYIRRLAQVRLEPTIPLEPPPTPEPIP